jgi:hypothetical protein
MQQQCGAECAQQLRCATVTREGDCISASTHIRRVLTVGRSYTVGLAQRQRSGCVGICCVTAGSRVRPERRRFIADRRDRGCTAAHRRVYSTALPPRAVLTVLSPILSDPSACVCLRCAVPCMPCRADSTRTAVHLSSSQCCRTCSRRTLHGVLRHIREQRTLECGPPGLVTRVGFVSVVSTRWALHNTTYGCGASTWRAPPGFGG